MRASVRVYDYPESVSGTRALGEQGQLIDGEFSLYDTHVDLQTQPITERVERPIAGETLRACAQYRREAAMPDVLRRGAKDLSSMSDAELLARQALAAEHVAVAVRGSVVELGGRIAVARSMPEPDTQFPQAYKLLWETLRKLDPDRRRLQPLPSHAAMRKL